MIIQVNGKDIDSRFGGGVVFGTNFTVNTNTALDVRITKSTVAEMLSPTSWVRTSENKYLVYKGMLVTVTDDTWLNNGIWEYIGPSEVAQADPTDSKNWIHIVKSDEIENTSIEDWQGRFYLGNGLQMTNTNTDDSDPINDSHTIDAKTTGYLTVGQNGINIDSTKIADSGSGTDHDKLATKGYVDSLVGGVTGGVRYLATVSPTEFEANYRVAQAVNGNMVKFDRAGDIYLTKTEEIEEGTEPTKVKEGDVVIFNETAGTWDYIPSGDDVEYTGIIVGNTTVVSPTLGGSATFAADGTLLTVAANNGTITYSPSQALTNAVSAAGTALQSIIGDSTTNDGLILDAYNTQFVDVRTTTMDSDNEIKIQSGVKVGTIENAIAQENRWVFVGYLRTEAEGDTVDALKAGDIVDVYDCIEGMEEILSPVYFNNDAEPLYRTGNDFVIPYGTKMVSKAAEGGTLIGELPVGIKLSHLYTDNVENESALNNIINTIVTRAHEGTLNGQVDSQSPRGVAVYRQVERSDGNNGLATAQNVRQYLDANLPVVQSKNQSLTVGNYYNGNGHYYNLDLVWLETI